MCEMRNEEECIEDHNLALNLNETTKTCLHQSQTITLNALLVKHYQRMRSGYYAEFIDSAHVHYVGDVIRP